MKGGLYITSLDIMTLGINYLEIEPWPLLLKLVGLSCWLGQNPPLCDEDDVLAGELLLQFTDQTGLDLLERLQLGNL